MDKKPYPFLPFEDSLVGEKILLVWQESHHSEKNLKEHLLKALGLTEDQVVFTPNAIKQKLMVSYPTEIRHLIDEKKFSQITVLLLNIAKGKSEQCPTPALDITFELIEWILTGFDLDDVLVETLSELFGTTLTHAFVDQVRAEYIKELRG
ncbi:VanZ family protein [Leptospira bandrabouensis]|uniref:VanZ family protein n=1 Tax=Leptospira bandrabouensis TaxID=2484903 RepID=A0A6H3NRC0_9LEPT|nr:VanZ family protein [Leptospira bandrabouensis]MCG6153899.1 VanZ family protein [Leptospira bandrabouensis]TGN08842.1 VanZ family protein [Leptospira bandrabouensis]TGN11379.1 VanZ family protein [Leptospira bandrabouensis]